MKFLVIVLAVALVASIVGNVFLVYTNNLVVTEKNDATSALEQLSSNYNTVVTERDSLIVERDVLKANVDVLVAERDSARTDAENLQTEINQLNSDVSSLVAERDSLKTERDVLISERDAALSDVEEITTRWRLINHIQNSDGTKLTFSGICVNTGLERLQGLRFHVKGYDLTGELVIDLYVGEMDIYSGFYVSYDETVNYAPHVLSSWNIELVYDE